jgi:hypothetical protein
MSPAYLPVLAQTVSPNDTGRLLWDVFMPRENVGSVSLKDLTTVDFRPAADRRGWNRRGRRIPLITPKKRDMEMEPIESNFRIDEREMQRLIERFLGNEAMIRDMIKADVPARTLELAAANYRRVELDVLQAWTTGIVTVRNPENNETYDVSFDFADERMSEAGTIWTSGGVNAYKEFVAFMTDAVDLVGPTAGAALRLPARTAILEDAPTLAGGASMSLANLEDRISQDLSSPFRFYLMEDTIDVFDDGGLKTTRTKKWPIGKIAAIPNDKRIGKTAFAPVGRAVSIANQVPEAKLDVNGCAVFPMEDNGGRELDVECQLNAFPVPDENRVAVIDTLIVS